MGSPYGLYWSLGTFSYTAITHLNERALAQVLSVSVNKAVSG